MPAAHFSWKIISHHFSRSIFADGLHGFVKNFEPPWLLMKFRRPIGSKALMRPLLRSFIEIIKLTDAWNDTCTYNKISQNFFTICDSNHFASMKWLCHHSHWRSYDTRLITSVNECEILGYISYGEMPNYIDFSGSSISLCINVCRRSRPSISSPSQSRHGIITFLR